ncbi:hypothetical protein [Bradyrhizobium liaoningense]|uniref:hypothetical protein n=1 Tax=Bradyrhizobium liaoningense TaxID=43992 RepID=UPI001BA7BDE3|nr:hypothetical protein [Bradyrhizobium liaoningense]MBR1033701.1 hypothetical protein [Bradyrhizobium liaoningense]
MIDSTSSAADRSNLSEEDKKLCNAAGSGAGYTLDQFNKDVTGWLVKKYGTDVQPGTKAIYIKGNGSRRDADVLVCCKHRRYIRFKSWDDQYYDEGTRIDNFSTHCGYSGAYPSIASISGIVEQHSGSRKDSKPSQARTATLPTG